MLILRSVVFNALFYLNLVAHLIGGLPTFFMSRRATVAVAKSWGHTSNFLLRVVAGITVDYRGLEKIPKGALIVAAKHQSVWETFTLVALLDDPTYILKRELTWIPLFGWYLIKGEMIPVDRGARGQALTSMTEGARKALARGRQIIIFPEGTRRAPGAEPTYKYGVVHLYAETATPCLPVALNSGLFWPRRKFLRYPGTIRLEVLDPIPPGLDKGVFAARLKQDIEGATARLIAQGEQELAASR
jgi:1-acyl-sn-glycerol-3-phosphate acyltransferase